MASPRMKQGVFISYSSRNEKQAAAIERALERAGFAVWRDRRKLEKNWSREIADALAHCDVLCVVWTGPAAQSKWVRHEWLTARALGKRIIPCMFPDAPELPLPLTNVHGVVFHPEAQGAKRLIDRLNAIEEPAGAWEYDLLPAGSRVPFNPDPHFTGRAAELTELYLALVGNLNPQGANHGGLAGMGGSGKTALAIEFAYRYAFAFSSVQWLQAADPDTWLEGFLALAREAAGLRSAAASTDMAERKQLLAGLQRWFAERTPSLLVMDNVTDPGLLNSEKMLGGLGFTPLTMGCSILFTTRKRVSLPGVFWQELKGLAPEEAYRLLTVERGPSSPTESARAKEICGLAGNLPLALVLANGYLQKYKDVTYREYGDVLAHERLGALDAGEGNDAELATRHEAVVAATLQNQWEMLPDANARKVFLIASSFAEAAIVPKARLALLAGIGPGAHALDRPFERSVRLLVELSLADEAEQRRGLQLHPLVRSFGARLLEEAGGDDFLGQSAVHLARAYADAGRLEREYLDRGVDEVIDDFAAAVERAHSGAAAEDLQAMRRLLDRERHHLRDIGPELPGGSLFQQLQYRAITSGERELANRMAAALETRAKPALLTVATSKPDHPALLRSLMGHAKPVSAICTRGLGGRVLSGDGDEKLILWDPGTGAVIRIIEREFPSLAGYRGVTGLDVSGDGRIAVSGSTDNKLVIWDLREARALTVWSPPLPRAFIGLPGDRSWITCAAISENGGRIVAGARDGRVFVLTNAGQMVRELKAHAKNLYALAMSADGSILLTGSYDRSVAAWNVETGQRLLAIDQPEIVSAVALSRDGRVGVCCCHDRTITLIDIEQRAIRKAWKGHEDGIHCLALDDDSRLLLSGSADDSIILWDLDTAAEVGRFEGHSGTVLSVAWLPGRPRYFASGATDATVMLWDSGKRQKTARMDGHEEVVGAIALTDDRSCAASGSWDGTLMFWEWAGDGIKGSIQMKYADRDPLSPNKIDAILATREGVLYVQSSKERAVFSRSWDGAVDGELPVRPGKRLFPMSSQPIATAAQGRLIAFACEHDVEICDLEYPKKRTILKGPAPITAVAMTPDGRYAAAGCWGVMLCELTTGRVIYHAKGSAAVDGIGISADGRRIAAACDSQVILYDFDFASSEPGCRVLNGHGERLRAVALSGDGRRAVSVALDGKLILWDAERGEAATVLLLNSPAWSVDLKGDRIVCGDQKGAVQFLRILE